MDPVKPEAPWVETGAIVVLRMYDVAYAIDLARLEEIGAMQAPGSMARIRFMRVAEKAVAYDVPPLEITVGALELELPTPGRARWIAEATARIFDFGTVSVAVRFPVERIPWNDFVSLSIAVENATSDRGASLWSDLLARVRTLIAPAVERPSATGLEEDYHLVVVHRFDRPMDAETLTDNLDLASILTGERRQLSAQARRELLRHAYSYYPDDLVVLTWDHALLYEPAGDMDVANVLEVANAQLLELRYYDDLLDQELPRMYDRVSQARSAIRALGRRRYAAIARELHALVAEITEITEKVENALRVTEDVHLARIYGSALELFRVPTWTAAVDRKLALIRDTYATLYDEAATGRAELLEAAIVLLIVLEIILALLL
ncbi:MAG: hypothetical protein HY704_13710 [Gemmatimonadetes bacterium]|nr:hypothetical protein [Gemmatimonadota bacterium]